MRRQLPKHWDYRGLEISIGRSFYVMKNVEDSRDSLEIPRTLAIDGLVLKKKKP